MPATMRQTTLTGITRPRITTYNSEYHGYNGYNDIQEKNKAFYSNTLNAIGAGKIETILRWNDNMLEDCHCYIQWLFPVDDLVSRFNAHSSLLSSSEIDFIVTDPVASLRYAYAFDRFLRFLGFRVLWRQKKIQRAWDERLYAINSSPHNFMRITRILKSMKLLGLHEYKSELLQALKYEVEHGLWPRGRNSLYQYWLPCLYDAHDNRKSYASMLFEVDESSRIISLTHIMKSNDCLASMILLKGIISKYLQTYLNFFVVLSCRQTQYTQNTSDTSDENDEDENDKDFKNEEDKEDKEDDDMNDNMNEMDRYNVIYRIFDHNQYVIRDVRKQECSQLVSFEGQKLDSGDYAGLWIEDNMEDLTTFDVQHAILNSYACRNEALSLVCVSLH